MDFEFSLLIGTHMKTYAPYIKNKINSEMEILITRDHVFGPLAKFEETITKS
ncbi:unnamed protein product [Arabidopsis halleri]